MAPLLLLYCSWPPEYLLWPLGATWPTLGNPDLYKCENLQKIHHLTKCTFTIIHLKITKLCFSHINIWIKFISLKMFSIIQILKTWFFQKSNFVCVIKIKSLQIVLVLKIVESIQCILIWYIFWVWKKKRFFNQKQRAFYWLKYFNSQTFTYIKQY